MKLVVRNCTEGQRKRRSATTGYHKDKDYQDYEDLAKTNLLCYAKYNYISRVIFNVREPVQGELLVVEASPEL